MMEIKKKLCESVDMFQEEILYLSHEIHDHPETGMQEYFACEILTAALQNHGFKTETGTGGLQTAFQAVLQTSERGPKIAILAEYDALEGIGHGCGHNTIAAAAAGAAFALKAHMDELGGTIAVIGTPAEETEGGKIILMNQGVFDDCDFIMMIHPCIGKGIVGRGALACTEVTFEFFGKSAHSADEASGVNALTACIGTFNNIANIRASFKEGQKANGIILCGGEASNVIPGYAKSTFCVRAKDLKELKEVTERIVNCAESASKAVGVEFRSVVGTMFSERKSNHVMDTLFRNNMKALGEKLEFPKPGEFEGSSDIGNLSLMKPAIHEYLSATCESMNLHSREFAQVAGEEGGDRVCLYGAKGLAMTACDIFLSEQLRKEIFREFSLLKK